MNSRTLIEYSWLTKEPPEEKVMDKSTFARLDEDDSRSGHDRLVDAVEQRRFDHPDETYEKSLFAVMRIMPLATRDYQDSNL